MNFFTSMMAGAAKAEESKLWLFMLLGAAQRDPFGMYRQGGPTSNNSTQIDPFCKHLKYYYYAET
jgi:hypothetical protein